MAPNRVTNELSQIADGVWIVESFSHVVLVETGDGLVAFDSSGAQTGPAVVESLRRWSDEPIDTLVYTHGHLDHVGGSRSFAADAHERGHRPPRVVGHRNVARRLDRYAQTDGYNRIINLRQFGGVPRSALGQQGLGAGTTFVPQGTLRPEVTYEHELRDEVGGIELQYRYALGEADDHTWTWIPDRRMIAAGDLFIWTFPNCGNPQKVQRYPIEWAEALREMAAMEPELFVPAHGLPIGGRDRIVRCLELVATTLEDLVRDVLDAMNAGATLDEIVHGVSVSPETLEVPFLRPLYDEPEFAVRNLWRLFGGWWDGNAAHLKPAPDDELSAELARLAGGAQALAERAIELSAAGDHRLACHLAEFAGRAEPESVSIHEARAQVYAVRRDTERSLMAKGIFAGARDESRLVTGELEPGATRPLRDRSRTDGTPSWTPSLG